jgi:molecular chaperone DnaK
MGKIIGIDLGTTNSVVAVMERGQPKVIPNTEGSRLTPSMVAFDEGGKVLVGEAARRRVLVDPETTVVSAKRFIGLGANDPIVRRAPCKVVTAPGGELAFEIFRVRHSPAEICARILTQLKRAADDYLGEPVTEAVISVPVSFNERQRQVIREAGAIAGLEIKRIINEPIAVALAYGIRKTKEQLIAVCSMGGGAFEVSILEVGGKVIETVAVCGDNQLGGDDLDHRLIDWLVGEFRKDTSIDVAADKKVIQRLREAAERAKLELSERQETEFHLPALTVDASGSKHLQKTLSRLMFENLIEDLVERTIVSCRKALADAGKQVTDLHAVVLAGGSTRIPRVAARLEEFFGRKADRSMNADEAVALGAAIQTGILSGDLKDILLLDTTSLSLGIEIDGGGAKVLIPRNTTIPTRKTELVSMPTAGPTAVSLHVVQGECPAAKDNTTIGRFQLGGLPPMPPGVRPVEVTVDIDANAVVHVAAKDQVTGQVETLRIGMPGASGGESRPAAAGTVAATLPRKAVPPAARSRSRSMGTVNGIGTFFHGADEPRPDGSRIATEFVVLFFFPLIPLRTRRIRKHEVTGNSMLIEVVEELPLLWSQIARTYVRVWLGVPLVCVGPLALVATVINILRHKLNGQFEGTTLEGFLYFLIFATAIYGIVMAAVLLGRARRA